MYTKLRGFCLGVMTVWMMSLAVVSYADDTEIYFAKAHAENDENRPQANVMIMLDTSGSMRNCRTGSSNNWCPDIENRRITLLHNAMKAIIADASPTVNIGLGRFQSGEGGRILLPVMPVNDLTREHFLTALNGINQGQTNTSPGNVQPSGSTPTALAYEEMANYMLGNSKSSYVDSYGVSGGEYCVSNSVTETCHDEVQWGDAVEVAFCDVQEASCTVSEGGWRNMGVGQSCDVSQSQFCRLPSWPGNWSTTACSTVDNLTCRHRKNSFLFFTWDEYDVRQYQTRELTYYQREQAGTVRVCEIESTECNDSRKIVDSKNQYVSPVNPANQCESNHIILFTDGAPSSDKPGNVKLVSCDGGSYSCQEKIAKHLNSETNKVKSVINTHNIGLYMGTATLANMEAVSEEGGGQTYDSDSAETLLQAFQDTLDLIDEQSRSISAPGVAVNTMNRFQHLDELYYAVFQPAESSFWNGNLKRYKLVGSEIHGQNNNAVDAATGYFSATSQSIWSTVVDGADATKGGARGALGTRKLYYSNAPGVSGVGSTSQLTWANSNDPNAIPANSFFSWPASATVNRQQMFDELKTMWADPMHSVPLMVNYGEDKNYVFVSTNGGMLHVIDTTDGSEVAAFMPYEMIRRAPEITTKLGLNGDNTRKIYGLDGSWVAWRKPGEDVTDAPEAVYLYGGMRRGGRSFYALDVTTPSSPTLKWQINSGDEGFERLGQTWSTPTLIKVPTSEGAVPALIFGGGYSPADHDGRIRTPSDTDAMGNTIYIVNAENGELIWSASHADLKWAVPGGVSVVDINFDGVADYLYFGDLGGQLFRVNMDHTTGNHSVHRIANLGYAGAGSATEADHRRFYEAPAVAFVKSGSQNHLYVVAASGYRAHPLDEATDEGLFVVFDEDALYNTTSSAVTLSDMANVSGISPQTVESDDRGWYYLFHEDVDRDGEKALSSPVVFDNKILLSTYAPTENQENENPCAVRYGAAFLHTVELRTGAAASILKDAPENPDGNRSQELGQSTPPPTPTLLVDEDGNLIVVVGTEVIGEGDLGDPKLRKRRWMQLPKDEAGEIRMRGADGGDDETDGDGDGEGV